MELPVFQNFDCHGCGYCCRNLVVNVTPAERQVILEAGWPAKLPGRELFTEYRFRGRRLIRLAHDGQGACVFLGQDGRCRIHAETGAAAKPLACRLYPFVPVPGVGSIRVELRFDCPSVAGNRGRSLARHRTEVAALAREVNVELAPASPRWGRVRLDATEFDALVKAFDDVLTAGRLPARSRLRAAACLLGLLHAVRPRRVRGSRFADLMDILGDTAIEEASRSTPPAPPGVKAQRLFRQWLFLHAIADEPAELACGPVEKLRRSWRRYGQSRRFAAGSGTVPAVRRDWPTVTFEQVARIGPAPDDAFEPLIRSMRVKLHAHAFAGPAYYGYELLPGLAALCLLPAVVGWLSRIEACRHARTALDPSDVLEGVRVAHHTFGVSPVFARISERLRLRALAEPGIPERLLQQFGP